jgi:hypothetical protein
MTKLAQLNEFRSLTYRYQSKLRLKSKKQAIQYVNERGFIFFWPIAGIELPSLWGAVAGDRPVPNDHDDPAHMTWGWKDSLIGKHAWFYGKILRKKATIISLDIAPYFYALTENYGSPEEDYLTSYEQGRMTQEAKTVYETLLMNGALDSISLRKAARLSGSTSEARYAKALTDLQADFKIMPVDVVDAGSWHYAFAYDIVSRHEPSLVEKARYIGELDARRKIIELYFQSVGAARITDLTKLFPWNHFDIENAIDKLIVDGLLVKNQLVDNLTGEWIILTQLA